MKTAVKRFISLFLAAVLLICIFPVSSIAETESTNCTTEYAIGDIIEFGSYPQECADLDEVDYVNLRELVDEWTSLGWYGGNGEYGASGHIDTNGTMHKTDYVMYADMIYKGSKYRILKITGKMPNNTGGVWEQCEARYPIYKFQPIKWEVKGVSDSNLMLECLSSIDSQPFNNYINGTTYNDGTIYCNENGEQFDPTIFETSSLYSWLNNEFYNTAFSDVEKKGIEGRVIIDSTDGSLDAGQIRQNKAKYMTEYAKAVEGQTIYSHDGVWWTSTRYYFPGSHKYSSRYLYVNGDYDCEYPATLGIGVVPYITVSHVYEEKIVQEPTCTEPGVKELTCSLCGKINSEEIPAKGHTFTQTVIAPTCKEQGYTEYACSCGYSYKDNILPATGHSYSSEIIKESTCIEKGTIKYTCTCGDSYTEELPLAEHKLTHIKNAPSCTESGNEYDICSECKQKFNEKEIKATSHSYTPVVIKESTCIEKGTIKYTCTCGDSYTEELPLAEHKLTHIKNAPSCTESGNEYDICSECKQKFNEKEIEATSHSYTPVVIKESTCIEKGTIKYTCTCGDSYTEELPLTEHKLTHIKNAPSCTESGNEYDLCSECKQKFNEKEIKATGHNYRKGICIDCGKYENWDYVITNGTVKITGYTGSEKSIEIPAEIEDCPVIEIAENTFAGNTEIEYVSFPNSVSVIGKNAFKGCSNLKEVCISDSVSTICQGAFADCTLLAIVYIASTNTKLTGAFSNNSSRLTFIVPESTETASNVAEEGFRYNTYTYPKEKNGKGAIAVKGTTVLYQDLEYNYWSKLVEKFPYAFYLYFDKLVFDGVEKNEIILSDDMNIDTGNQYFTLNNVYINLTIDGRFITFKKLTKLLEKGDINAIITFDGSEGVTRSFLQEIGDFFTNFFNAISRVVNAVIRIFRRK